MNDILNILTNFTLSGAVKLIGAILLLVIGFKLVGTILKIVKKGRGYQKLDSMIQTALRIIIEYGLKIILIVTAASLIGVPMASMVTVLGSAGLAVGLALQGSLVNIAGGFLVFTFKPFAIGDFIIAGDQSGTVEDIGLLYTKILTIDNKLVIIPNGTVSNQTITNVSAMDTRRCDRVFTVAYQSDIDNVREIMTNVALSDPNVLKDPAPQILLKEHGDSALVFELRVWCKNSDYWTVYFAVCENVKKAFDKAGIEIPFPQLDVHFDKDAK